MFAQTLPRNVVSVHIPAPLVALSLYSLPILITMYAFWDLYSDYLLSQIGRHLEEYDFIIVGAGSAGSVLANKLSESGDHNVLLLEAGGNPSPFQSVPMYANAILHTPAVDYDFYTVPQNNACLALKEQRSFWPRGSGLGGSSNLNSMFYQRGNKNDYDKWAELSDGDQWKFDQVLRNFKNIEDYHGYYFSEKWHSNDGKGVYVSVSNEKRLLAEFLEAGKEMGYPTKDVNGLQRASFSPLDVNIKNGRRFGAISAFLEPILNRKNLRIYRYARVLKLRLDKNKRAYGVTFQRHRKTEFVRARKEIILSSGAIDSPKILMLSGIGPRQHLEKLAIKSVVDLPVGANLQDHVMANIGPFIIQTPRTTFNLDRDLNLETIRLYLKSQTGVLSTPMTNSGVAYVYSSIAKEQMRTTNSSTDMIPPDIQLVLYPSAPSALTNPIIEKAFSLKPGYIQSYLRNFTVKDAFFINVMLAKPKSRGEMKLVSSNPMDKPMLNPKYFSHPDDIKRLADGLSFAVSLVESTKSFKRHGARLIDKHLPGCEGFPLRTLEYYECYARHITMTVYHPCGTCTMGKVVNDSKAVVNHKLNVLRTSGLRVVDASIIPEIPNSNINAAVYMIADKAAEMILDHWKLHRTQRQII